MSEVYCETHGNQSNHAFVCQHLFKGLAMRENVGFCTPWEEIADDEPKEAWCNDCEKILDEQQGWNDISEEFAQFKIVCICCYSSISELNSCENYKSNE